MVRVKVKRIEGRPRVSRVARPRKSIILPDEDEFFIDDVDLADVLRRGNCVLDEFVDVAKEESIQPTTEIPPLEDQEFQDP